MKSRTTEDKLFERMPPAIQEAQRKLQHENRMRKRAEWKAKQEAIK